MKASLLVPPSLLLKELPMTVRGGHWQAHPGGNHECLPLGHGCLSRSSSGSSGKEEKLMMEVVRGYKVEVRGERAWRHLLEGGVHSSVELYNFECFIPLQFGADQVLLQPQQH